MALAAVPMVVVKVYLGTCRATGRMLEGALVAAVAGIAAVSIAAIAASDLGLSRADLPRDISAVAPALRKRIDITDFSRVVPLLTLRYI